MSAPSKYARTSRPRDRSYKGMGKHGERHYDTLRGESQPIVGGSLLALEAKLNSITNEYTSPKV